MRRRTPPTTDSSTAQGGIQHSTPSSPLSSSPNLTASDSFLLESDSSRRTSSTKIPSTGAKLQLSPELPDPPSDSPIGTPLTTKDYESILKPYTPSFSGGLGQRNLLLALAYLNKS